MKTKEGNTLAFPDEGAVFRCNPMEPNSKSFITACAIHRNWPSTNIGNLFTGDNDFDQGDHERWVYSSKAATVAGASAINIRR